MIKLSIKARTVVKASTKTSPSITVIWGVGGICSRITGINATNETIKAPILTILLCRFCSWKKIPILMIAKSNRGIKIVTIPTIGLLKRRICKWAELKASGLYFFESLILFSFSCSKEEAANIVRGNDYSYSLFIF